MLYVARNKRTGSRTGKPRMKLQIIKNGRIVASKQKAGEFTPEEIADFVNAGPYQSKPNIDTLPEYLL